MTREDIIRMAREVGFDDFEQDYMLERFAALVAAAERERKPDYVWPTLKDYEADIGYEVNDAVRQGWNMARTTNKRFLQTAATREGGEE